jgi:hypothetical protein
MKAKTAKPPAEAAWCHIPIGPATGTLIVCESELPSISNADLRRLGISRADLHRVFAEGRAMMVERGLDPGGGGRIRPVADKALDGTWLVNLVGRAKGRIPARAI